MRSQGLPSGSSGVIGLGHAVTFFDLRLSHTAVTHSYCYRFSLARLLLPFWGEETADDGEPAVIRKLMGLAVAVVAIGGVLQISMSVWRSATGPISPPPPGPIRPTRLAAVDEAEAGSAVTGTVIRIIDARTIVVRLEDRTEIVRYIGVGMPAADAGGGEELAPREATEFNRSLVSDQTVRLELDAEERNREGHLLAYVWIGDVMANAELVGQGYARAVSAAPNVRHEDRLRRLQDEARLLQLGLWRSGGSSHRPVARESPRLKLVEVSTCPATHPVKGNFKTPAGERCVYYMPGNRQYDQTKARRCYATEGDAQQDGCRPLHR